VVIAMRESREAAALNNSRKEAKMRRMNQLLVLLLVLGIALLGVVAPVIAGQKGGAGGGAPKPDGKFQLMTTSISANMGPTWADGRLSYNNQDYKFRTEAETMADPDVLQRLAGQQITVEGLVYNLNNVSDFAGTFKRLKPEVIKAMGGTGRDPVFQNDKGVVLRVTKRERQDPSLQVRLLSDSFKVTMREF
jgi:hypothetical protein